MPCSRDIRAGCRGSTSPSGSTGSASITPAKARSFLAPAFENSGELKARFSVHQINSGYAMRGEALDEVGAAAIAAMLEVFEDDGLAVDFDLEPGQMAVRRQSSLGPQPHGVCRLSRTRPQAPPRPLVDARSRPPRLPRLSPTSGGSA